VYHPRSMSEPAAPDREDDGRAEARLARELAALSDDARTRVILGALTVATDQTRRRRYPSGDTIAAIAAIVVAVASLVLTVDQARTQRKQLSAAVWPSLRVAYSNLDDPEHPQHRLFLINGGLGPARIESFSIAWRGKPVRVVEDWSKAACPNVPLGRWIFSGQTGTLLSPGAQSTVVRHPRMAGGDDDRCIDQTMMGEAEIRVCYCSALDDCWVVSPDVEPTPVRDCNESRRQPQFQSGD
jgi:hypothetical protein